MSHVPGLATRQRPSSAPHHDEPTGEVAFRPFESARLPLLIQVPTVRPARRPSAVAMVRVRGNSWGRPRRRLRREVRVAGYVFLMIAPLSLALGLLFGKPAASAGGADDRPDDFVAVRPPAVWLSIESPSADRVAPVILPDYVLPDDGSGSEELAHAGG